MFAIAQWVKKSKGIDQEASVRHTYVWTDNEWLKMIKTGQCVAVNLIYIKYKPFRNHSHIFLIHVAW